MHGLSIGAEEEDIHKIHDHDNFYLKRSNTKGKNL